MMLSRNGRRKTIAGTVMVALVAVLFTPTPAFAAAGSTTRVSIASDGSQGNDDSSVTSLSADGRYVAFISLATNLVSDDTTRNFDVFVADRQAGATSRVSVSSTGAQSNGNSFSPALSGDGRYVAFTSDATNLVAGDTNNTRDAFVHDRQTGETTRVSVASDGTQATGFTFGVSISADGRYVTFDSAAANLVAVDTNRSTDVFVHDRQTGDTSRVSVASNPPASEGVAASFNSAISGDGRYVAFESQAANLVLGDINARPDVFVHDRQTAATTRVSVASDGAEGNQGGTFPAIDAGGRYVVFQSGSSNLVAGDTNGLDDVFAHDRQTGETTRVSVASDGTQGNGGSSGRAATSADVRYIVFMSSASNLVAGDTNGKQDVFVHDRLSGATSRVSRANDGREGQSDSKWGTISGDGRYVAFESLSNFVGDDTNNRNDVFIRDREGTPPARFVSVGDVAVYEGGDGTRSAVFTVSLSKPSAAQVSVSYATVNGSAVDTSDFTSKLGTLVFAPNTTSLTVKVPVTSDIVDEANEAFTLALSAATGAAIGDGTGIGTIVDDDPNPIVGPRLAVGDVSVHEGNSGGRVAVFNVSLLSSTSAVTVSFATAKGTATGADFTAKSGTLNFPPGTTSANVKVAITPDTLIEGTQTFTVKLSSASGATIIDDTGEGTIIDND